MVLSSDERRGEWTDAVSVPFPRASGMRALWMLVRTSVRVSPGQSVLCLFESASRAVEVLQPLYLAWLVAGILHHSLVELALGAAAFTFSGGLNLSMAMIGVRARIKQLEQVGFEFDRRIAATMSAIPTLAHLESPEFLDQLQTLHDQQSTLGEAWANVLWSLNSVILVGGTLALAAGANWRLLLVAAAGLPMMAATRWIVRWEAEAEESAAPRGRLVKSLAALALSPAAASEIRVFGQATTIRQKLREATRAWRQPWVDLTRRQSVLEGASTLFFFIVAVGDLAWLISDALKGRVAVPTVALALVVVGRLQNSGQNLMEVAQRVAEITRTARRYLWIMEYASRVERVLPGRRKPPKLLREGICVDHVTYRYPAGNQVSLDNVSLNLPAGSTVALVGENGAGKSTLVKLLLGLYQPTEGRVLVDGVDLAEFDLVEWRQTAAGAFQDYARFELTLGEAIGIGSLPHVNDDDRVHEALRDAASEAVLEAAPAGLITQLGTTWPEGVELSGGQWQRVAIARGMMRREPVLLVLDEPTASLDATTEHDLFERYAETSRRARHRGAITILVTHRFSTASVADLVVVLQQGRLMEVGSHQDLLQRDGLYADLYRLQANGYR